VVVSFAGFFSAMDLLLTVIRSESHAKALSDRLVFQTRLADRTKGLDEPLVLGC
jgi:hypothetical protein